MAFEFFNSSVGWFFTGASTVPRRQDPSIHSLLLLPSKLHFLFLYVSQLETWKLYTNISQSKTLDQSSNLLIFLEVVGNAGLVFFFKQFCYFVANLENRWKTVWSFEFLGFLVELRFSRFFQFFMITELVYISIHGQTGWTVWFGSVLKPCIEWFLSMVLKTEFVKEP